MRSTFAAHPSQPFAPTSQMLIDLRPAAAGGRAHVERTLQPEHLGHAEHGVLPEVLHVRVLTLADDVDDLIEVQVPRGHRKPSDS